MYDRKNAVQKILIRKQYFQQYLSKCAVPVWCGITCQNCYVIKNELTMCTLQMCMNQDNSELIQVNVVCS